VTTSSGSASPSMRWADVYVPHVSPASMSPASMRWADVYVSGLGPPSPAWARWLSLSWWWAHVGQEERVDHRDERSVHVGARHHVATVEA